MAGKCILVLNGLSDNTTRAVLGFNDYTTIGAGGAVVRETSHSPCYRPMQYSTADTNQDLIYLTFSLSP